MEISSNAFLLGKVIEGMIEQQVGNIKDPLITQERYKEICNQFGVPNISEELSKSIIKWLNNSDNFNKVSNVFGFIQIACDKNNIIKEKL